MLHTYMMEQFQPGKGQQSPEVQRALLDVKSMRRYVRKGLSFLSSGGSMVEPTIEFANAYFYAEQDPKTSSYSFGLAQKKAGKSNLIPLEEARVKRVRELLYGVYKESLGLPGIDEALLTEEDKGILTTVREGFQR